MRLSDGFVLFTPHLFVFNLSLFVPHHLLPFNSHSAFVCIHCRKSEEGLQSEPPHLSPHSTLHNHPDYPPMRENKIQQKPKGNPSFFFFLLVQQVPRKDMQPFNISGDFGLCNPAAVEYCCRQGFLSFFCLKLFLNIKHHPFIFYFFFQASKPFNHLG